MAKNPWRIPVAAATAVIAAGIPAACSSHGAGRDASVTGAGDPYYPRLGNRGYDTSHYTPDLSIDPVHGGLTGTATIQARATTTLRRVTFDLAGPQADRVTIDGRPAASRQRTGKLIITPARPILPGHNFVVRVPYHGTPRPLPDASGNRTGAAAVGWHHDGNEIYVASEPAGARSWYPVNDTPRDKATYTFHLTAPRGYTAVANGRPTGQRSSGANSTFSWESSAPMASYLTTIDVARFTTLTGTGPHGLPIRSYAPPDLAAKARHTFTDLPAMIRYFETIVGPYPFDAAGVTVMSSAFRWSLETQTRPVYGSTILSLDPHVAQEGIAHELAHQWFGDSLTLTDWRDIWLNEGFATYLSWLWLEHHGDRGFLTGLIRSQYGYETNAPDYATLLQHPDLPATQILAILRRQFQPDGHPVADTQILTAMGLRSPTELTARKALGLLGVKPGSADADAYLQEARSSAPATPPRTDLFTTAVYNRGAMTLQALRLRVGDPTFFAILRAYFTQHRDGNVTTADFTAIAEKTSRKNLDAFFRTWLYQPAAPPMPALRPTQ